MTIDRPCLAAAMRLLDTAKDAGFTFVRIAPGEDGPLHGTRKTPGFVDEVVHHEARCDRAGVRGLRRLAVAAAGLKLRAV